MKASCRAPGLVALFLLELCVTRLAVAGAPQLTPPSHGGSGLPGRLDILGATAASYPEIHARFVVLTPEYEPVVGLASSDITIQLDGLPAELAELKAAAGKNKTSIRIALVIDTSGSMRGAYLDAAREAILGFASRLRSEGHLSLVTVARSARLRLAGSDIQEPLRSEVASLRPVGATALFDGISLAIDEAAAGADRSAVIVMSDGDDNASRMSSSSLAAKAASSGVPIYFVKIGDRPSGAMDALAARSGGEVVTSQASSDLGGVYRRIAGKIDAVYTAVIRAPDTASRSKYHRMLISASLPTGPVEGATDVSEVTDDPPPSQPPIWPWIVAGLLGALNVGLLGAFVFRKRGASRLSGVGPGGCLPVPPGRKKARR